MKQNVDVSCSEFRWTYLHMVSIFSSWTIRKMHDFQGYFFQDFPGTKWFSSTFQVLEFSRKNRGLSRRHGILLRWSSRTMTTLHQDPWRHTIRRGRVVNVAPNPLVSHCQWCKPEVS